MVLGKAGHITAASPGGARYDASLTREQRSDYANGIWLCGLHADQVDRDEEHFTENELRKWKEQAEDRQFRDCDEGYQDPNDDLDETDAEARLRLGLSSSDHIRALVPKLINACGHDLEAMVHEPGWPLLPLSLTLHDAKTDLTVTDVMLAAAMERGENIAIIAPPGTGKSTTLGQLAQSILTKGEVVPVRIKLGAWSVQGEGLLKFACAKPSLRAFREEHLMLAATHGKLALLLDGWNEVDAEARRRLISEVQALKRDFPLLSLAVSTRRQATDLPLSPRVIEIEPLSEEQQLALAKALRDDEGEQLLDRAWRTPGVRNLVANPLYLTAILSEAQGGSLPETREGILRLLIERHEKVAENAEAYRANLHDAQRDYLVTIAATTIATANTNISEAHARVVAKGTADRLVTSGQISVPPQPAFVLDTLVNHHALVRTGGSPPSLSFQHQQFQEWFASFDVEEAMLASASGNVGAAQRLREVILNLPPWEEAILFACERLSRDARTKQASVAKAIIEALSIDPMLAAEMIFRSAVEVWSLVKDDVLAFVGRWHTDGRVDRALRFMISTGRPDFADEAWSLITATDNQTQLRALRVARRFRPGVLGPNPESRLGKLSPQQREVVASELVDHGDASAIELVATYALTENNPEVLSEIIQALVFRRADRWVQKLLEKAPDQVWTDLAKRGYSRELAGTAAGARLDEELASIRSQITNPNERLSQLLSSQSTMKLESEVTEAISSSEFNVDDRNAAYVLQELHGRAPTAVTGALVKRLKSGLAVPYGCADLLKDAPLFDDDDISNRLLHAEKTQGIQKALAALAGANVIKVLLNELVSRHTALGQSSSDQQRNEYYGLKDVIQATKPEPFAEALTAVGDTDNIETITVLANILAGHSNEHSGDAPPEIKSSAVSQTVGSWAKKLLADAGSSRTGRSEVARAIGRLADPNLLGELLLLLDADIAGISVDREAARIARAKGQSIHVLSLHDIQYGQALLAIGGPDVIKAMQDRLIVPEFGVRAAIVLRQLWQREQPAERSRPFGARWPDYSEVKANRFARANHAIETHPYAESILTAAASLVYEADPALQNLALALARVGFTLPYRDGGSLIEKLLALSLPITEKRYVFQALVASGQVLDADLMLEGLKEFLEKAKTQSWLLDDNHSDLSEWLELVAFSNRPSAIMDALAMLQLKSHQIWRLREFISSLRYLPQGAEDTLNAIATVHPEFADMYEWQEALLSLGTNSSTFGLLETLAEAKGQSKLDNWRTAQQIAERARGDPLLRAELIARYGDTSNSLRHLMGRVLIEISDQEIVMVLVRQYIAAGRRFDGDLRKAIEKAATHHRPSQEWKGAFEVLSAPIPELRKQLFEMVELGGPEGELAVDCLTCIDRLRDEHGRPDLEPRHPDSASRKAWPREAATPPGEASKTSTEEEYE